MSAILVADESFDPSVFKGASCAFGVFDGVHLGHRYLLDRAIETAHESDGPSIALTFDIDPDELFHADRLKKLLSNEQRLQRLSSTGVDYVVALPFTREFAALSPQDFLWETFKGNTPAFLHVGNDFHFGARAAGNVDDLVSWADSMHATIRAHHLVSADGKAITATRIRLLLADGQVDRAAELLGYPYTLIDAVHPGRGEGADFGFRTANLEVEPLRRVLGAGVYGGYACVNGKRYRAAISVGVSPVFADQTDATCEVHILDFDDDIYGQEIAVEFVAWLRPMIKFESTQELIDTVMGNIAWVRENLPL